MTIGRPRMSALILAMTTSIDGYATGPDISVEDAMGVGGEALHEGVVGGVPVDQLVAKSLSAGIVACIVGRTMHDLGVPHWEDVPYPAADGRADPRAVARPADEERVVPVRGGHR